MMSSIPGLAFFAAGGPAAVGVGAFLSLLALVLVPLVFVKSRGLTGLLRIIFILQVVIFGIGLTAAAYGVLLWFFGMPLAGDLIAGGASATVLAYVIDGLGRAIARMLREQTP